MDKGLAELVRRAARASPHDLRATAEILNRHAARKESAVVLATIDEAVGKVKTKYADDPDKLREFAQYVGAYTTPIAEHRTSKRSNDAPNYNALREKIESGIINTYSGLSANKRTGITVQQMIQDVHGLRQLVSGNPISLARYLVTIRKNGMVEYDRESRTYTIHPQVNAEMVVRAAGKILQRQGYVHFYDLQKAGIRGNSRAIGIYLSRWAQGNKLKSERISLGSAKHARVYYKGKTPLLSPVDKVEYALKGRKSATLAYLEAQTGLGRISISRVMGSRHLWRVEHSGRGVTYHVK